VNHGPFRNNGMSSLQKTMNDQRVRSQQQMDRQRKSLHDFSKRQVQRQRELTETMMRNRRVSGTAPLSPAEFLSTYRLALPVGTSQMVYNLKFGKNLLGRSWLADLRFKGGSGVERRHAVLHVTREGVSVARCRERTDVRVNGRLIITIQVLQVGDTLTVGDQVLTLVQH
jgi:pSer/pThr/pTyr-binding forkhead associated (FHA) protein